MNRTNAQSTLVPDALATIAACVHSQPLMELAVALRAIVTGSLSLPADRVDAISRITRDLANSQRCLQAHLTLNDPRVKYYAKAFCRACIQAVPLTAENPTRDLVWQARVKVALIQDASLQSHAKLLLDHVRLRVTSAQTNPTPLHRANGTMPNCTPKPYSLRKHSLVDARRRRRKRIQLLSQLQRRFLSRCRPLSFRSPASFRAMPSRLLCRGNVAPCGMLPLVRDMHQCLRFGICAAYRRHSINSVQDFRNRFRRERLRQMIAMNLARFVE